MNRLDFSAHRGMHFCMGVNDVGEYLNAVYFSVEFGLMHALGAFYAIFEFMVLAS